MTTRYIGNINQIGDFVIQRGFLRLDEALGRLDDTVGRVLSNNQFNEFDSPGEESTALKVAKHFRLRDNKFVYWAPVGVEGVTNRSAGIRWHVAGVSPDRMEFDVKTSTKMVLNASGQVGIGTTTPITTGATVLLDVRGLVAMNTTAIHPSGSHVLTIGSQTGKASILCLPTDSGGETTIQFWANASGSTAVGLGSSKPGSALTNDLVFSTFASGAWSERARIVNATGDLLLGTTTDIVGKGQLQIRANAQYGMNIIGTGGGAPMMAFFKDGTPTKAFTYGMMTPSTESVINDLTWGIYTGSGSVTEGMRLVNATGDFLIGTTGDSARLTVQGAIELATVQISGNSLSGTTAVTMLGLTQTWTTTGIAKGIVQNITHTGSTAGTGVLMDLQIGGTSKFNVRVDQTAASGALGSSSLSFIDLAHTWNTTGNPTAFKLNVTNTASGTTAKLFDWQVGGTSRLHLDKIGQIVQSPVHTTAGGTSFLISHSGPVSGAVNADFIGLKYQAFAIAPASGASNLMGLAFDMSFLSGVWASVTATSADATMSGGTISDYRHFSAHLYGAGSNITTWSGYETAIDDAGSFAWGGTITDAHGFRFRNYNQAGTGAITNLYGILIESPDPGLTVTNFHAGAFGGNVNLTDDSYVYWSTALVDTRASAAGGTFRYSSVLDGWEWVASVNWGGTAAARTIYADVSQFSLPGQSIGIINLASIFWTAASGDIYANRTAEITYDSVNNKLNFFTLGPTSILTLGATIIPKVNIAPPGGVNFVFDTTTGTKFGQATNQKMGWFNATPVIQQTDGAGLTNNVTSGGTTDTIANFTDLLIYANDAAAIRNDIYQLARKIKIVDDALRLYGLLS